MAARFGLLGYDTENLGDEIQSLAAQRFLPRVDQVVPREGLDADPGEPLRLILNGWFMHRPRTWPPHPRLQPLITSFHISQRRHSRWRLWEPIPSRTMLSSAGLDYLRRHGPVGARDAATRRLLQDHDVEAYESGCLTLTLPAAAGPRGDQVVANDLPPHLLTALAARTRRPPVVTSHQDAVTRGHDQRMARAQALLDLYAGARAVVTTRLHCALPCLALGTPVLFIAMGPEAGRLEPATRFAHCTNEADFLAGRVDFDPEAPPPNPDRHRSVADALAARCEAFVAA